VGGTARNYLARLNANGTLDAGFNPNVSGRSSSSVNCTAIQADGKIIVGGYFSTVGGIGRNGIARLNTDGTVDASFNPDLSDGVNSVTVQADGRIIISGVFTRVGGVARNTLVRLANDAATQNLAVTSANRIEWLRGGASPEVQYVGFDVSTDGGTTWTVLGTGKRIPGGWETVGLCLPASGQVRARARVTGGSGNGSSGLVETVAAFSLASPSPCMTGLGTFQLSFTNLSGGTFTALATTNLTLHSSNWTVLGPATEIFPGLFQFTDLAATNFPYRFYQIRSP
jgi:uncharacterized delta-60 repeat protein